MARTTRRLRLAALALAGGLTLTGCSVFNPITTMQAYAPSDGVRVAITDFVSVENLMILTTGEGDEGFLIGAVVNRSTDDVEVTISLGEGSGEFPIRVGAQDMVSLIDADITIESVGVPPGATLASQVSTPEAGSFPVPIPVLDGTLPAYEEFLAEHDA